MMCARSVMRSSKLLLAACYVMAHRGLGYCDFGPLLANPRPDVASRVPLLARSLLIRPQNLVNELLHRLQLGPGPRRNFALRWDRARQRLPYDSPVDPELPRHASDRPYPKAVLPPDLFKQLNLASPVHRLPVLAGRIRVGRSIA